MNSAPRPALFASPCLSQLLLPRPCSISEAPVSNYPGFPRLCQPPARGTLPLHTPFAPRHLPLRAPFALRILGQYKLFRINTYRMSTSVDSKELTEYLSPLAATLMKNMGGRGVLLLTRFLGVNDPLPQDGRERTVGGQSSHDLNIRGQRAVGGDHTRLCSHSRVRLFRQGPGLQRRQQIDSLARAQQFNG